MTKTEKVTREDALSAINALQAAETIERSSIIYFINSLSNNKLISLRQADEWVDFLLVYNITPKIVLSIIKKYFI